MAIKPMPHAESTFFDFKNFKRQPVACVAMEVAGHADTGRWFILEPLLPPAADPPAIPTQTDSGNAQD